MASPFNPPIEGDEDDISLTSTAGSVFQDEYEVETIHAQDIINGQKVYLVKWKGYEDLRCTWEPRDSFNTKEILLEWEDKKRQIKRGVREPFDVEAWQAECEAFETAREDRKRRRQEKRARLSLLGPENQELTAVPTATVPTPDLEPIIPPSAPSDMSSDDDRPLVQRRGLEQNSPSKADSVQSRSPSQPQTTAASNQPKPPAVQPTSALPVNQTTSRTERPKAAPPKPVDIKLAEGRFERRDLANVLNRARQQPNPPAEKNKPWKLFRTTHRFEKASRQDPEPNIDDLELQSPNTWSPFQMSSFLRKRQEKEDDNLFVEQDEVPETQQNSVSRTPSASVDSPVLQSQQLNTVEHSSAIPPSTISPSGYTQEVGESLVTESSDNVMPKRLIPLGPRNWQPPPVGRRQLRRKDDLLCRISYGTEPFEIGDTLLCDISTFTREIICKLRSEGEVRVSFEEVCTLDRFQSLSHESYRLLNRVGYSSPKGSLRFAGINGVLPRHLREPTPPKDKSVTRRLLERPERQGRYEESGRSREEGLTAWRLLSQSIPSTPQVGDSSLAIKGRALQARDPRLEVSTTRKNEVSTVSQSAQSTVMPTTAVIGQDESTAADPDAMDTSSDTSSEPSEDMMITTTSQPPVSSGIDVPSPVSVTSNEKHTNQIIPETQDVQMLDISNAENINVKEFLTNIFLTNYKITYNEIAAVTSHSSIKLANCFYLWFPEDADADFQVLEQFLDTHYAIVLSNRKQNDWEKFTKSSSGVALFHHSFLHFSEMSGFHKLMMNSSFNFWNVSLQTAIPNVEPQTHFQRLFPQGTGYLMTEDFMLHARDAAIMILAWFRDTALSKFPGTLKMMVRPNVLEWLDQMSKEDPRFAVMAVLIGDTACHGDASNWPVEARDLDCFYNPSLESPVISLAEVPGIELADSSSNPDAKGAEQQKNTDLLCEVFAAWAILNAASLRKFHIITHNKPLERWQKWQHIEITQGANDFFRKSNINKDHYTKWLAQGASTSSSSALSPSKSAAALPVSSSTKQPAKSAPILPTAPGPAAAPRPLNERAVKAHPGTGPDHRPSR
uniref:Chromo domain-containing protein 1 n=1 Tax=Talaromyces marneffei PM1 TaxID=1077442 RepID=A0A093XET6_TALMA